MLRLEMNYPHMCKSVLTHSSFILVMNLGNDISLLLYLIFLIKGWHKSVDQEKKIDPYHVNIIC